VTSLSRQTAAIPTAPAQPGETLQIGRQWSLGVPVIGGDASLGFSDFSLQPGDCLVLFMAVRTGDLADPESGDFDCPECFTVLPQLNPVPGDIAITVSDHGVAARW
jgi:hypothetical protein